MGKGESEIRSRRKVIIALLAALAVPFTVTVCGVCEIYLNNSEEFLFVLSDFWGWSIFIGAAVFAVVAAVLILLRGKAFRVALSLTVWLALMCYVQSAFLNAGSGALQADGLITAPSTGMIVVNLLVWLLTGAACVCAALFVKDKQMLGTLAMIAIVMTLVVQSINLTVSLVNSNEKEKNETVLTDENLFTVSEKDNVIVFILDRFDLYYYQQIVEKDPAFFDGLDGFTLYDNNISLYSRTYPAITYMLTGTENSFEVTRPAYFKQAYGSSAFFRDLKANNYQINLYTAAFYAYDDAAVFDGLVDNVSRYDDYKISDRSKLVTKMLSLALYRYMPLVLKQSLSVASSDFGNLVSYDTENDREQYVMNDAETYRKFRESGLSAQAAQNTFSFIHLNGCHSPYTMDEDGNAIESNNYASAAFPAIRGCFHMIYEYIGQLKELGVYKDATIIITGDHARAMDDRTDVEDARVTALFVKEKGSEGTPLAVSSAPVCQENLRAEIVKSAGIRTDNSYGTAFSEIPETAEIPRKYCFQKDCDDGDEIVVYSVVGDAKSFANWTLTGRIKIGEIYK